ncbi:MAG: phage tail protein [Actinomycetota bacterium]
MANVLTSWEQDPVASYLFGVTVDGQDGFTVFSAAAGLSEENSVIFFRQRGSDGKLQVKKVPGNYTWSDITLKRGITTSTDMWDWRQKVLAGDMEGARASGSITIYSPDLNPVAKWEFTNGWPSKWSGGDLSADSDDTFIEELTITHEGLSWSA